jgi:hypothetical protein
MIAGSAPHARNPEALGRWWIGAVSLAAVLALGRPYAGVRHDARLYFGDALARLHPLGVGRDPIFLNDGQFGFSLYSELTTRLIAAFGVDHTSLGLVIASLLLWFAAMLALTGRLFAGQPSERLWLARVLVVVAPAYYGAYRIFSYAEPFATPRVLAEALVLGGLAAFLGGRRLVALACFAAAGLFHPIMALGGLAVFYLTLCLGDRRWFWALVPGVAATLAAAALGLPLVDRLVAVMDHDWRLVVEARSPHVFPSLWKLEGWGRLAIQVVTLAASAALMRGAPRNLMLAALAGGLGGILFALVFGDGLSLVLVLQAQTWRTLWLMAVLAAAGLAVCILEARGRGLGAQAALGLLVLGWLQIDSGWPALLFAALAVAALVADRWPPPASRLVRVAVWSSMGLAAVAWAAAQVGLAAPLFLSPPSASRHLWGVIWNTGLPALAVAAAASAWAFRPTLRPPLAALAAGGVVLVLAAGLLWDRRAPYERFVESYRADGLPRMLAARPGEVLWLSDDLEPWFVLHRASWVSRTQAAGVVFSRPLAQQMRNRTYRLRMSGFAGDNWRTLYSYLPRPLPPKAKVDAFCRAPDAPAWVVTPYAPGKVAPRELGATLWAAPAAQVRVMGTATTRSWSVVQVYAVTPCRGR